MFHLIYSVPDFLVNIIEFVTIVQKHVNHTRTAKNFLQNKRRYDKHVNATVFDQTLKSV
jgi:hypothetical protein